VWLNWLKYISWFYYGNEAALINQWRDVDDLPCTNIDEGLPCYTNGEEILALVGFDKVKFNFEEKKANGLIRFFFLSSLEQFRS